MWVRPADSACYVLCSVLRSIQVSILSIFSANNSDNVSALTFILLLVSPSQPPPPSGATSASPPSSTSLGQARLTFLTPSRTWKTCLVLCSSLTRRLTLISAAPGVLRLDKFSLHQEGDSPSLQEIFPRLMLCKAGHFPRQAVPEAGGDGG